MDDILLLGSERPGITCENESLFQLDDKYFFPISPAYNNYYSFQGETSFFENEPVRI